MDSPSIPAGKYETQFTKENHMTKRQIFIDTETTGLSAKGGHRIVELAAVEAVDGKLTGRTFHTYLNPGRSIDPYAQKVHGLSIEFLANKPRFTDIADGFISFVQGTECLMHNAPFDTGFINAELVAAGYGERLQQMANIVCTVSLAKSRFPGEPASLDSLIERSGNSTMRKHHSALEDAQLLANVYIKLLANPGANPISTMQPRTPVSTLPDILPFVAKHAEHYLTLHRVHPARTYNYQARGFKDQPVIEASRHAQKCRIGESWMYIAVPTGSKLNGLAQEEKLYVGAQTQDRMFRGDGLGGDNFHHAEMRAGKGSSNLVSFLRSGRAVEIHRIPSAQMCKVVQSVPELERLLPLTQQPLTSTKHLGWWFEQYVLYCDAQIWRWNSKPADMIIHKVLSATAMR